MKKATLTILILATFSYLYSANLKDMGNLIDLSGQRYGRWEVISYSYTNSVAYWLCKCDCGAIRTVSSASLRLGTSKSCGCLHSEITTNRQITHGKSRTSEYKIWSLIKNRCLNPNYTKYYLYGGRGITMCDSWLNSFEAFSNDMGPRPSPKHSIDRIKQNGNYEPGNCRWATSTEQANNRRGNVLIDYKGQTLTLIQVCRNLNINYNTIITRLRLGWSVNDALYTKIKIYQR